MILASIYLLGFCLLISKHKFFKIESLPIKWLLAIIGIKTIGCLAYYWIYFYYYPGGFKSDSTSTMHDAAIIYNALPNHISDFLKMIFGFHSDEIDDPLYQLYFKYIDKWGDSDSTRGFFLNDNRTPIRLNAIIMLFSFGNYAVHSIVMLMLSFIGQFSMYKTVSPYFIGKEKVLAVILFLTPSVLFWTSGVLKEPIAVFLSGIFIYCFFKLFIKQKKSIKYQITFLLSCFLFFILKPYILLLIGIPAILFAIAEKLKIKKIGLFYICSIILIYTVSIISLKLFFKKDVINAIVVRQNDFVSLSKGGIFFLNHKHYLRLEYKDSDKYYLADTAKKLYQIKQHTSLMYWDIRHLRDTIFINDNKDTSYFQLIAICPPSGSAIKMNRLTYSASSFIKLIPQSLFNTIAKPFFYDSHSATEMMASFENLLLLVYLIICLCFFAPINDNKSIFYFCLWVTLCSFLLIGLTTTVTGAIARYKTPFMPFFLMTPLLCLDIEKLRSYFYKCKHILSQYRLKK